MGKKLRYMITVFCLWVLSAMTASAAGRVQAMFHTDDGPAPSVRTYLFYLGTEGYEAPYADAGIPFGFDVDTAAERAGALWDYIKKGDIEPDIVSITDDGGMAIFDVERAGCYLFCGEDVVLDGTVYHPVPFLCYLGHDAVDIEMKFVVDPPYVPDVVENKEKPNASGNKPPSGATTDRTSGNGSSSGTKIDEGRTPSSGNAKADGSIIEDEQTPLARFVMDTIRKMGDAGITWEMVVLAALLLTASLLCGLFMWKAGRRKKEE